MIICATFLGQVLKFTLVSSSETLKMLFKVTVWGRVCFAELRPNNSAAGFGYATSCYSDELWYTILHFFNARPTFYNFRVYFSSALLLVYLFTLLSLLFLKCLPRSPVAPFTATIEANRLQIYHPIAQFT